MMNQNERLCPLPHAIVPAEELAARMTRLRARLDERAPDWQLAAVMGRINVYYLTGTMQNGVLLIPRDDEAVFRVRKSYDRAVRESRFPVIRPMQSFRDAREDVREPVERVHVEKHVLTLAHYELFSKYFGAARTEALDPHIRYVRSVKSRFELGFIERAGTIQRRVLEETVPDLLREGMSEVTLATELMDELIRAGHQGVSRVGSFNAELFLGHVCFGDNALYGGPFAGPGGVRGFGPSAPFYGNHERKLQPGDIISIDIGCNIEGYHSDKTVTRCFRTPWPDRAAELHALCRQIERQTAAKLRPGAIPSDLYAGALESVPPDLQASFMGIGGEQVKFVGHSVGLEIDESPALAKGFDEPIEAGMVFALEPKIWIPGVGMVGEENTYVVTPDGGSCVSA